MVPPSSRREIAYLMEFSTSGWKQQARYQSFWLDHQCEIARSGDHQNGLFNIEIELQHTDLLLEIHSLHRVTFQGVP